VGRSREENSGPFSGQLPLGLVRLLEDVRFSWSGCDRCCRDRLNRTTSITLWTHHDDLWLLNKYTLCLCLCLSLSLSFSVRVCQLVCVVNADSIEGYMILAPKMKRKYHGMKSLAVQSGTHSSELYRVQCVSASLSTGPSVSATIAGGG
jgi:hypothetical protein